ncbi:LPS assembly lipoprotein LptE [Curvibacter sp. RS43]|uniref:LPS-assembly lipoprotein LptE n=1 Tax=Curvibacter microcysteis TaxID=3026419 RepID=UPI00236150C3|nr:LPS assembly lipoprotein LptE [Curvibacter sp. RS43]MDD0810816.1 LPS assembly lipoprotein LptE [Curvibacter sp. RS43]
MQRRTALIWPMGLLLAGCGFKLRQAPDFAFDSAFINGLNNSPLVIELRRNLEATDRVEVVQDPRQMERAQVIIDLLSDQREKVVVALNASGQVRQFQLRVRLRFKLRTLQGKELISPTEILQQRDINYSETLALAKETEEALLYKSMQTDVVQQLMRRLAAVREL